jgi:hypothetical protein
VNNIVTYAVWSTYAGAGIAVATSNHYLDFDRVAVPTMAAGVLAVLLWPLVFLGAHVRL